ncbi:MAG: type II toxin-antitoxin system VapC family toxin [Cyanobacteria bacterium]|nr:type II toxin-antitoxin system VapC family toxin [Cyanobacteriota bacterium]
MKRILDAYALMVFLEREPGFEKVKAIIAMSAEKNNDLLITSVNYGEIYYIILREYGQDKANEIERVLKSLPIEVVDVDIQIAKQAGVFKAGNKISYADCFAAALTKINNGELITGDKEFKVLENEIKINWID